MNMSTIFIEPEGYNLLNTAEYYESGGVLFYWARLTATLIYQLYFGHSAMGLFFW